MWPPVKKGNPAMAGGLPLQFVTILRMISFASAKPGLAGTKQDNVGVPPWRDGRPQDGQSRETRDPYNLLPFLRRFHSEKAGQRYLKIPSRALPL